MENKPCVSPSFFQVVDEDAVVRESLTGLYPLLGNRAQFRWIQQRISSMETIWVEAGRSFSAKYNLKWKAKHVTYPSVLCLLDSLIHVGLTRSLKRVTLVL